MKANRQTNTSPELALRSALHRAGFRFRTHLRPVRSIRCTADVVFPRQRVAVFVDGCYWHGCPEHGTWPSTNSAYWTAKIRGNMERDRRNDALLADAGWLVIRLWEHETTAKGVERVAAAIVARRREPSNASGRPR
jgi:DNA mismatch endonuclease, patch repair protein